MKTFSLIRIAALSLIAMGAAHAGDVPTATVKFNDLDLSSKAGQTALYRRIDKAARQVCAPLDLSQSAAPFSRHTPYELCLSNAMTGAVEKLSNTGFTQYVQTKSGPAFIKLASAD